MNGLPVVVHCLFLVSLSGSAVFAAERGMSIAEFLPAGYIRDGSVSYQKEIQNAIDEAARKAGVLVFPAMTYAVDETGWQLRSDVTLKMSGAVFQVSPDCQKDGAVFHGEDVKDVTLTGGEIAGRNDVWADGVNVRGIHISGKSARIRISEMHFHDLSSNAIGLFGTSDHCLRDVWLRDVIAENCCKKYPDYLSGEKGEPGSRREDQGDVAFYFVEDFLVAGCRFERSRSDGTHFYRCRRGQITDNRIYRAKMGGYFIETCEEVVGRGNIMRQNGSRGVTIERGSRDCVFSDNVVSQSGREGLWAPDCTGLVVTGNVFNRNGRKPNGPEPRYIWNANITINEAHADPLQLAHRGLPRQRQFDLYRFQPNRRDPGRSHEGHAEHRRQKQRDPGRESQNPGRRREPSRGGDSRKSRPGRIPKVRPSGGIAQCAASPL